MRILARSEVTVNRIHDWYCKSDRWHDLMVGQVLPTVLEGIALDGDVLEIGPGPGLVSKALLDYGVEHLTTVEIDAAAAERLQARHGDRITVHTGDAANMPLPADAFDTVVCCTMLHHVPTVEQQDAILRECARVLKPGGVLTGSDSKTDLRFRLFHLFDIHNPVEVATLEGRLLDAGFTQATVTELPGRFRFRATA